MQLEIFMKVVHLHALVLGREIAPFRDVARRRDDHAVRVVQLVAVRGRERGDPVFADVEFASERVHAQALAFLRVGGETRLWVRAAEQERRALPRRDLREEEEGRGVC